MGNLFMLKNGLIVRIYTPILVGLKLWSLVYSKFIRKKKCGELKMITNFLPSIPLKDGDYSLPLESRMILWPILTNRMWQKWLYISEAGTQEFCGFHSPCLGYTRLEARIHVRSVMTPRLACCKEAQASHVVPGGPEVPGMCLEPFGTSSPVGPLTQCLWAPDQPVLPRAERLLCLSLSEFLTHTIMSK